MDRTAYHMGNGEICISAGSHAGTAEMSVPQVFARITAALDQANIAYMLCGSFASAYYGAPRSTLTTAIAVALILKGKVQQHRQWMTRSFAVALIFLEVRVIAGVPVGELGTPAIETIVWGCIAFSIVAADIVLQLQELRRSLPVLPKTEVASY